MATAKREPVDATRALILSEEGKVAVFLKAEGSFKDHYLLPGRTFYEPVHRETEVVDFLDRRLNLSAFEEDVQHPYGWSQEAKWLEKDEAGNVLTEKDYPMSNMLYGKAVNQAEFEKSFEQRDELTYAKVAWIDPKELAEQGENYNLDYPIAPETFKLIQEVGNEINGEISPENVLETFENKYQEPEIEAKPRENIPSAQTWMFRQNEGKLEVMLLGRATESFHGKLAPPGGRLDGYLERDAHLEKENGLQASLREAKEEVGFEHGNETVYKLGYVENNFERTDRESHYEIRVYGMMVDMDKSNTLSVTSPESHSAHWVPIDELKESTDPKSGETVVTWNDFTLAGRTGEIAIQIQEMMADQNIDPAELDLAKLAELGVFEDYSERDANVDINQDPAVIWMIDAHNAHQMNLEIPGTSSMEQEWQLDVQVQRDMELDP